MQQAGSTTRILILGRGVFGSLRKIRRHKIRIGEQLSSDELGRVLIKEAATMFADHHGIDDKWKRESGGAVRERVNDGSVSERPGLGGPR